MTPAVSRKLCVRVGSSRSVISPASTPLPASLPCTSGTRLGGARPLQVRSTKRRMAPAGPNGSPRPRMRGARSRDPDVDVVACAGLGEDDLLELPGERSPRRGVGRQPIGA